MTNKQDGTVDNLAANRNMYVNFLKIVELINERQKSVLNQFDITHSQYNILRILKGAAPSSLNLKQIQERMIFGSPDVTRLIDRLIGKNLVAREANEQDKRKIDVRLSEFGSQLLLELNPNMERTIFNFFEDIVSSEEATQVNRVLDRLLNALAIR